HLPPMTSRAASRPQLYDCVFIEILSTNVLVGTRQQGKYLIVGNQVIYHNFGPRQYQRSLHQGKANAETETFMKIAVIGSGRIGGVVGKLWAQAGHQVCFSSRHPETLDRLVTESGPNASSGSISEALAFGEVILVSIPYGSLPAFGKEYGPLLNGKIVL